jgi:hypothetical protein
MARSTLILLAALALGTLPADRAAAFDGTFPWQYGFWQPYGAQYSTSIRTPPHFALNPPVYYGSRHARPYGLSPFAAVPQVTAGDDYRSRLHPETAPYHGCALCLAGSHTIEGAAVERVAKGPVRSNPLADQDPQVAKRSP